MQLPSSGLQTETCISWGDPELFTCTSLDNIIERIILYKYLSRTIGPLM